MSLSRREVMTVAAATVTLPMLDASLGALRSASAAATGSAPATRPTSKPAAPAAEVPGWFTTTLKPADLKDNEFTAVTGHAIVLSRADKSVAAISNKCTHKGCAINPKAGAKILSCTCHGAQFNLDGGVAKAPATTPLPHYAIRVNDQGFIEIDPGQKPARDDKAASVSIG